MANVCVGKDFLEIFVKNVMTIISHIPFVPVSAFRKLTNTSHYRFYTSACNCHDEGTIDCDQQTGSCNCKSNFQGRRCADCATGYFGPECKSKPKIAKFLKILVLEILESL